MRALEGSLRSGSMLARSVWLADGTNPAQIAIDGVAVTMTNGYPAGTAVGIAQYAGRRHRCAANTTPGRFRTIVVNATTVQFQLNGATDPATCFVQYIGAASGERATDHRHRDSGPDEAGC